MRNQDLYGVSSNPTIMNRLQDFISNIATLGGAPDLRSLHTNDRWVVQDLLELTMLLVHVHELDVHGDTLPATNAIYYSDNFDRANTCFILTAAFLATNLSNVDIIIGCGMSETSAIETIRQFGNHHDGDRNADEDAATLGAKMLFDNLTKEYYGRLSILLQKLTTVQDDNGVGSAENHDIDGKNISLSNGSTIKVQYQYHESNLNTGNERKFLLLHGVIQLDCVTNHLLDRLLNEQNTSVVLSSTSKITTKSFRHEYMEHVFNACSSAIYSFDSVDDQQMLSHAVTNGMVSLTENREFLPFANMLFIM